MTLYLNNPIYLHNSVRSSFSNLTKALEHQNESDAKIIDTCGSSLENHTFDSLTKLIKNPDSKLNFIFKEGKEEASAARAAEPPAETPASTAPAAEPPASTAPAAEKEAAAAAAATTGEEGLNNLFKSLPDINFSQVIKEHRLGGGGRVKRTRNLRNRGNNKSQKQRKRKHLNYTKK